MWITIADKNVRHLWVCEECDDMVYVEPSFYADSGEPFCCECDYNMSYVRTEIEAPVASF